MQNYKKNFVTRTLAWVLTVVMVVTMLPMGVFAETYKTTELVGNQSVEVEKTTDWEPTEENLKGKNFWPLGNKQYLREVSRVGEPMKNPILHYEGYFTRPDGRTVIRLTMRKFDKVGSGVWHVMQMKLEDSLFKNIDWNDTQTGIYKGVSQNAFDGWYHDDIAYKEITPFGNTNIINAGTTNVKEINISDNNNTASGPATNEVPINLVLNEGINIDSFDHEPLAQMRLLDDSKTQVAAYTDAGTGIANYSTYTFSSILPIKTNYKQNLLRERRSNNTSNRFFKGSNSSVYYNKEKGYLEVTHNYNKSSLPSNTYYGAQLGYRQTVDKKFFDALKPLDADGTIAHIYSISNNGLPTQGRLDDQGYPTADGAVPVLKRNINFPKGSDVGFIQIANTEFYRQQEAQMGIKTNITTLQPLDSWFDGIESLLNGGQGTVVRYYVNNDKIEKWLNERDDGLSYTPFYSSVIKDNKDGYAKYEFTLDDDQTLNPGDTINIEFASAYGNGTGTNGQGTDGLKTMTMFFTVKGEGNDMYLGTNFYHMGYTVAGLRDNGKKYEYRVQNGMPMTLKKGTKITLYTYYDTGKDAIFKFNNSTTKSYSVKMGKDHSPIEFEWQGTFSAGTIATTYFKPDVDEIFFGDEKITGRTQYENGEVNIKRFVNDKNVQTIIAKPGNTKNKDDSRIEVEVNGKKKLGYEFDTKTPGMKKDGKTARTFKMPKLERDMPILFTNTDVQTLAEESRPPVIEQVQTKFHFDLNGERSKTNLEVLDRIVPLSKEYKYDPATGEANHKYKASGFEGENVKYVDDNNKTIEVDGRTYQNIQNHDGLEYDLTKADQKEAFLMRQMPTKDDVKVPQGKRILGWTTKKLVDTADKNVVDQFNELKDADKIIKDVADWAKVDDKENYIFDANSPIDKERTVYAVYGEGINIILHSNNTDDPKNETTITVPIVISDVDKTDKIIDSVTSPTFNKMKGNLVIKELPKVPVTGEQEEVAKITDDKARLFNKVGHSFIGWTTKRYTNDASSEFAAGNNNERIGEITKGLVANGTKRIPQKTEWLKDLNTVQNTRYIPNGYSVAVRPQDVDRNITEIRKAIEEGKDLHLYANYRKFFDVKVNASYKNIDKNQGTYGEYVNTVDDGKKKAAKIGLLRRTAVTPYGKPTVHQNANYYPFDGGLKDWNGQDQTLTWKVQGFDELGQRMSYVSVVVPEDKVNAYNNFAVPNWGDLGMKTYLRINNNDGTTTVEETAPRNLHKDAGNPYGDHLAKDQAYNIGVDVYTSATSRKAETADRSGTDEVVGYEIWNTSTPIDIPKPSFDTVYDTDKQVKLNWGEAEKKADIKKIKLKVADGEEVVLEKQDDGSYTNGTITATPEGDKLVIRPLNLEGKGGKNILAKYVVEKAGQDQEGPQGDIQINTKGYSAPVQRMKQIPNNGVGNPVVEFDIPNPTINKPTKDTEYQVQKWDDTNKKWVDVPGAKYTMTAQDTLGATKEIPLPKDGVADGDILRIKSKQPDSFETGSTQTMDTLGNVTGDFYAPINDKSTKLKNYIVLDTKGPEIQNAKAKDELFRRFIDVSAAIKEIPEGRKVTVTIKYPNEDAFEKTFEISTDNPNQDKSYAIEYLNNIVRKGAEQNQIPTIKLTAVDEFGNKEEKKVEYKATHVLEVMIRGERANRKFVSVTADKAGATVTIKVMKGVNEVASGTANVDTAGKFVKLSFSNSEGPYKLQSGDVLVISGIAKEDEKDFTTNPFKVRIK